MLNIFNSLRDFTSISVTFRLVLSFACGTIIGLERSYRNKPAGFRTHTLVCLAACIASVTGLYLYLVAELPTDISRIGAQVVSGLGFIGAGTIIVTKKHTVKGLTTAAGMWTAGIIGLAIGAGFYEGGITATALVLIIETWMDKLRKSIKHSTEFNFAVSYYHRADLNQVLRLAKDNNVTITNLQITGTSEESVHMYNAMLSLRSDADLNHETLLKKITNMPGIISAEEL